MYFFQREGGGFYLQIMDICKWIDCYYHININKMIRIGEDGEHWGPFVYRPVTNIVTKWFILTERPYVQDWDMIHMWLDIVNYNYSSVKLLIEPFIASIHLGLDRKPNINISMIEDMFPDGIPRVTELSGDISLAAKNCYNRLMKMIYS